MTTHDGFATGDDDERRKIGLAESGPIFSIEVDVSDLIFQELPNYELSPPTHGPALIDTGADITCMDIGVIGNLGVVANGAAFTHTSEGGFITPTYPVSITLPGVSDGVRFEYLTVVGLDLRSAASGHRDLLCLIGRDVLQEFEFFFDGPRGRWSLKSDRRIIPAL